MLDIGLQELVLILVIALLVFGPKRLPELGRALGRGMREFRRASEEFRSTIETNLQLNEPEPVPPTSEPIVTAPSQTSVEAAAGPLPDSLLNPYSDEFQAPAEPYLAHRGGRLFHARECGWTAKLSEPERVYFKRVADARSQGFSPCPVCEPWEPG